MFVQPVAGQAVPDPERGGFLPEIGAEVPENQYWLRRENAGEIKRAMPKAESDSVVETESTVLESLAVEPVTQKKGVKE